MRANALLSKGESRQAIELYTEVLYNRARGHIVAFLNRSMAYILERRPELAVTDAYRAVQATHMFRNYTSRKRHSKDLEIKRYLRAESSRVLYKYDWTKGNRRFIPFTDTAWTKRPLASLVMNMDEEDCPVWGDDGITLEAMCLRLEVRAVYRLCGALYNCTGGALQDAVGIISDYLPKPSIFAPERRCFNQLGTDILNRVTHVIEGFRKDGEETHDEHRLLMRSSAPRALRTKPESMLKTRVTSSPAIQYWADPYEPDFRKSEVHQELRDYAATSSESCVPMVIDQSSIGLLPRIEMRASKDHLPGDTLLSERCPLHVTTGSPEKVLDSWDSDKAGGYLRLYCDACAIALLLPEEITTYIIAQCTIHDCSPASTTPERSKKASDEEAAAESPAGKRRWCASTGISFCSSEHEAIYCGPTCRRNSRFFDAGIHESEIEPELRYQRDDSKNQPRRDYTPGHPYSLYAHSKTQTLYDLLFLRIYATARNEYQHPLALIRFLRANLGLPSVQPRVEVDGTKSTELPWTFQNNVVRPIWYMNRYHHALGQDPLLYLENSDGWIINTLLAKIQLSTHISRGARSAIAYDVEKETRTYRFRGLEPWISDGADAVYESEAAFDEVWTAHLDPVVSMIRVANEAKGEKPNCWLKYDEGVKVIAGQPDDPCDKQGVAIRQGQELLRARHKFLGGSPYDFTPLSQRDPGPSVCATRVDTSPENDPDKQHPTIEMECETTQAEVTEDICIPDSEEEKSDSAGSSDEAMLDILDEDSPEDEIPVPSAQSPPTAAEYAALDGQVEDLEKPQSPPTDADYVAELDDQAENLEKRLEAVKKAVLTKKDPAPNADDPGGSDRKHQDKKDTTRGKEAATSADDPDSPNRKHQDKKRRLSQVAREKKLPTKHWSGHTRVRRLQAYRPPRNSLFPTGESADVQQTSAKVQREEARPSAPVVDDGFSDAPVGQIFSSNVSDDEAEKRQEPVAANRPLKTLEIRSITDVRKGSQKRDPDDESSGDIEKKDQVLATLEEPLELRSLTNVGRGTSKHDPGEGSSGSVKGKAVLRGGDALPRICKSRALRKLRMLLEDWMEVD